MYKFVKTKQGEVLTFDRPEFELNGTRYRLIGLERRGTEWIHTIRNEDTGEVREITDKNLQRWFRHQNSDSTQS